jgi:thiol-disulfide isomerase/thioredoxin
MALTKTQFEAGMTTQQYIDQIKVNKDPFVEIYHQVQVPREASDLFGGLAEPVNLAVITADWCGDAVSTTPAVLRLAESTPNISVQVFNRDDDVPFANSFLPEHRAGTVPIFVVLDQAMNEVARFIETASGLVPQIDAMDEAVEQEAAAGSEEEARAAKRGKRTAHRVAHARDWGEVILKEFSQVVSTGLNLPATDRPAVGGTKWPPED